MTTPTLKYHGINQYVNLTGISLPAATPTPILGSSGLDVSSFSTGRILLSVPSGNPITAISIQWSLDLTGTHWSDTDSSVTLPAGGFGPSSTCFDIYFPVILGLLMQITLTSTLGATVNADLVFRGQTGGL